MIVEVYESISDGSITVVDKDHLQKAIILEDDALLIRTIEGDTWEDCMIQHHKLMGWEPYKPF
jgi:hypothetical protein